MCFQTVYKYPSVALMACFGKKFLKGQKYCFGGLRVEESKNNIAAFICFILKINTFVVESFKLSY